MSLPKIPSLSLFWNIPFAQHIQACVIVISIHISSINYRTLKEKEFCVIYLYISYRDLHIAVVKEEPADR